MDESTALQHAGELLGLSSIALLKQGGQKSVYRADRGAERVVLKVVFLEGANDPNAFERCAREVDLLKSIDSPNIVKVLTDLETIGQPPSTAIWLEEELDGSDFSDLIGSPWTWSDTAAMLDGIGHGLGAMHKKDYIHRDLSAGNIRRTSNGIWKVMDPGVAKHLNRTSITGIWQPGTLGYFSPEHASPGGRTTAASDVFCMGILGFIALTGTFPISPAQGLENYRNALLGADIPSIAQLRPDLDEGAAAIIDRCLLRQPARRYLDAREVVDALTQLAEEGKTQ